VNVLGYCNTNNKAPSWAVVGYYTPASLKDEALFKNGTEKKT